MSVLVPVLFGLALLPSAFVFGVTLSPDRKVRSRAAVLAQFALTLPLLAHTTGWPFALTLAAIVTTAVLVIAVRVRWLRGLAATAGFVLLVAAALIDGSTRRVGTQTTVEAVADAPAQRWEATVYLPLADNEGRSFSSDEWEKALAEIVAPFGGATLGDPQEGCWVDARGRTIREPVRPVVVSFAPERLDEFRRAAHAVGRRLGQEAVYVRFEQPRVELVLVGR